MNLKFAVKLAISIALLLAITAIFTMSRRAKSAALQSYSTQLQSGIGSSFTVAQNAFGATTSTNTLSSSLSNRAGISLSQSVKDKLTEYEQKIFSQGSRLTSQQVATIISDEFFSVLPNLTNADLVYIGQHSKNAPAFNIQQADQYDLRASCCNTPIATWSSKAKAYRDSSNQKAIDLRNATPDFILSEVSNRVNKLDTALTAWTGSGNISPAQAFWLCYSVISDDFGAKSDSDLATEMQALADTDFSSLGFDMPAPSQGQKPFGDIGYLRASPVAKVFTDSIQLSLLNRIKTACGIS